MPPGIVRVTAGGRFDVADPVDIVEVTGYFCQCYQYTDLLDYQIVDAAYR